MVDCKGSGISSVEMILAKLQNYGLGVRGVCNKSRNEYNAFLQRIRAAG